MGGWKGGRKIEPSSRIYVNKREEGQGRSSFSYFCDVVRGCILYLLYFVLFWIASQNVKPRASYDIWIQIIHVFKMKGLLIFILVLIKYSQQEEAFCEDCSEKKLSTWSRWSECSKSCGDGSKRSRNRHLIDNKSDKKCMQECPHVFEEYTECKTTCCPIPCSYSYTEWSNCTGCGKNGSQYRQMIINKSSFCGGKSCPNTTLQERTCDPNR